MLKPTGKNDYIVLSALYIIMAFICGITWLKWGNLTIDCGREMYIPAAINEGKRLYLDLWYPYGPLIPYWNALLYRLFGTQLSVLYANGIAVISIIVLTLYSLSRVFLPISHSFTIVFAFLLQAFQLNIFNYVLPYSYAAVYGSMFSVVLIWLLVQNCYKDEPWHIVAAGMISGMTLLTKIEFGMASYGILMIAIAIRAFTNRSVKKFTYDIFLCIPGLLLSIGIYMKLVSISSFAFIFEENIAISPKSYFVKNYGILWPKSLDFTMDVPVLFKSVFVGLSGAVILLACLWIASVYWKARRTMSILAIGLCFFHLSVAFTSKVLKIDLPSLLLDVAPYFFFNSGLIWMSVILLLFTFVTWKNSGYSNRDAATLIVTIGSILLGARMLTSMAPTNYPIYYDIVPYLGWYLALYRFSGKWQVRPTEKIWRAFNILICCGLVAITMSHYGVYRRPYLLSTARGAIYTEQQKGEAYSQLIDFLTLAKSRSEYFVTMPEDVSLYYFTATQAPSRWHTITPYTLPPGDLTSRYLDELDRARIKYVILSNRSAIEYGTPLFGIDYNTSIYQWITQKYKVIGQVGVYERVVSPPHWGALIYQRMGD